MERDDNVRTERVTSADEAGLTRIEQVVARAWQDVLLAPVAGPDDDFFDAGGDSLKAITFAMELERALGLELSPTLIYEAPSFRGFCEALREHGALSGNGPLVLLKAGAGSPVFIIPGIGGNVVEILPMARRMAYPGPVIGIRARGLARGEMPHSTVEAMAADYLREIKAHPELRKIPVIILTTSKADEDVVACYRDGANSFITKPVSFAALIDVVQALGNYWLQIVDLPVEPAGGEA